jgi:hypothetical protein
MSKLVLLAACLFALAQSGDAATRTEFPGALYADCLVTGEKVASLGQGIVTHHGVVPAPDVLMFNRIARDGRGFRVASKANNSNATWVFDGAWRIDGRISHGVQGHIWRGSELVVMEPTGQAQESQGYRYVAAGGTLIEGSPTYHPNTPLARALGVTRLYGWTQLDADLFVGQGDLGGTAFQYRGRHFLLEPGDTQFVQGHKVGDRLAIAVTRFGPTAGVCHELAVGEVAALPPYPDLMPAPVPTPVPVPEPEPTPQLPASLEADIVAEWDAIGGFPDPVEAGIILNRIAWKHRALGWGLSAKPQGNGCPSPAGRIACDILHHKPSDTLWDTFRDNGPTWGQAHHHGDPTGRPWLAPVDPGGSGPIEPPPPPVDVDALKKRLAQLDAELESAHRALARTRDELSAERTRVIDLEAQLVGVIERLGQAAAAVADQDAQIAAAVAAALAKVRCTSSIFGIKVPCKVIYK